MVICLSPLIQKSSLILKDVETVVKPQKKTNKKQNKQTQKKPEITTIVVMTTFYILRKSHRAISFFLHVIT